MKAGLIIVGMIAAAAPKAAQSQVQPAPVPRTAFIATMDSEFKKMDADKNNIVTRVEIEQFLKATSLVAAQQRNAALFRQLDTDKNGQISAVEFGKLQVTPSAPNASPLLAQADLNKDQSISLVEYRTSKLANFDRMDADKDGVVTPAEMKAAGLIK